MSRQGFAEEILAMLNGPFKDSRSSLQVAAIREMCIEEIYGIHMGLGLPRDHEKGA